jgi:hypothetical protein
MRMVTVLLTLTVAAPAFAQGAPAWADGDVLRSCGSPNGTAISCPVNLVKGRDYRLFRHGDGTEGRVELVNPVGVVTISLYPGDLEGGRRSGVPRRLHGHLPDQGHAATRTVRGPDLCRAGDGLPGRRQDAVRDRAGRQGEGRSLLRPRDRLVPGGASCGPNLHLHLHRRVRPSHLAGQERPRARQGPVAQRCARGSPVPRQDGRPVLLRYRRPRQPVHAQPEVSLSRALGASGGPNAVRGMAPQSPPGPPGSAVRVQGCKAASAGEV